MGAMLVRHLSLNVSNYRSAMSLPEYLEQQNVIGISEIDTGPSPDGSAIPGA